MGSRRRQRHRRLSRKKRQKHPPRGSNRRYLRGGGRKGTKRVRFHPTPEIHVISQIEETSSGQCRGNNKTLFPAPLNRAGICRETNLCLGLGQFTEEIRTHFQNFDNRVLPFLAKVSVLGFGSNAAVFGLEFHRENHTANTILKVSRKKESPDDNHGGTARFSDSLFYEFLVGCFLNEKRKRFPCFVETWRLGIFKNSRQWNEFSLFADRLSGGDDDDDTTEKNAAMENVQQTFARSLYFFDDERENAITWEKLRADPKNMENEITRSCQVDTDTTAAATAADDELDFADGRQYVLLTESVHSALKLEKAIETHADFVLYELITTLLQIYEPLCALGSQFTHYDLHNGNVMLFCLPQNAVVRMIYHLPQNRGTLSFTTTKIAKMIDYGRAFFHSDAPEDQNTALESSAAFFEKLQTHCPQYIQRGYSLVSEEPGAPRRLEYHIDSRTPNESHDIILLSHIAHDWNNNKIVRRNDSPPANSNDRALAEFMYQKFFPEYLQKVIVDTTQLVGKEQLPWGAPPNPARGWPRPDSEEHSSINNIYDARDMLEFSFSQIQPFLPQISSDDNSCIGTMDIFLDPENPLPISYQPNPAFHVYGGGAASLRL